MNRLATNLSILMEFSNISSKELSTELRVDPSVVSRWRSGERRLAEGGALADKLAYFFMGRKPNEVKELLRTFCPLETTMELRVEEILAKWLCRLPSDEKMLMSTAHEIKNVAHRTHSRYVEGDKAVRRILSEFLDYALTLSDPGEILFACPDGLSIFTRDSGYNLPLQEQLWKIFRRGTGLRTMVSRSSEGLY